MIWVNLELRSGDIACLNPNHIVASMVNAEGYAVVVTADGREWESSICASPEVGCNTCDGTGRVVVQGHPPQVNGCETCKGTGRIPGRTAAVLLANGISAAVIQLVEANNRRATLAGRR